MKRFWPLLTLSFFAPLVTFAYVKWFALSEEIIEAQHGLVPFYSISSNEVIIASGLSLLIIMIWCIADHNTQSTRPLAFFAQKHHDKINRISQILIGVFLLMASFSWEIILVSDMPVYDLATRMLQYFQALLGILLILNVKPRITSAALFLFSASVTLYCGIGNFLENILLTMMAGYIHLIHTTEGSKLFQLKAKALTFVRIAFGISLVTMAFTEKLLYPELSMHFLDLHHWNFIQPILPWFTNTLFILAAGFVELTAGILLMLGYLTRFTTLLTITVFTASAITMCKYFGLIEIEYLPAYSAATLLFAFGNSTFSHRNRSQNNIE